MITPETKKKKLGQVLEKQWKAIGPYLSKRYYKQRYQLILTNKAVPEKIKELGVYPNKVRLMYLVSLAYNYYFNQQITPEECLFLVEHYKGKMLKKIKRYNKVGTVNQMLPLPDPDKTKEELKVRGFKPLDKIKTDKDKFYVISNIDRTAYPKSFSTFQRCYKFMVKWGVMGRTGMSIPKKFQ